MVTLHVSVAVQLVICGQVTHVLLLSYVPVAQRVQLPVPSPT